MRKNIIIKSILNFEDDWEVNDVFVVVTKLVLTVANICWHKIEVLPRKVQHWIIPGWILVDLINVEV